MPIRVYIDQSNPHVSPVLLPQVGVFVLIFILSFSSVDPTVAGTTLSSPLHSLISARPLHQFPYHDRIHPILGLPGLPPRHPLRPTLRH